MHRFYLPPEQTKGEVVQLSESDAHHAARVLRLQADDPATILNGAGVEMRGKVETVGKRTVTVRISERIEHLPHPAEVTLLQAIAKNAAMDGLIHRAVELGCRRVVPLLAERSVSRPDDAEGKRAKWQTIALEAMKQSGNPWLTRVEAPVTPGAWLKRGEKFELLLIGSLLDTPQHLRTHFQTFHRSHGRLPRSIGVIVGPEGDFSPAEYSAFREAGAKAIALGPLVLRVETAATAVLAMIQHELTAQ
jgi:16S rRNA (uracil1498-N3)-methyltransferase